MADGAVVDHRSSWARRVEAPLHLHDRRPEQESAPSGIRRVFAVILDYLPRGNTLDAQTFAQRHLLLCWVLFLHLPSLFLFAVWQGYGARHSLVEIATPAACLVFGRLARNRRLAAFFVTAGLVFCSSVLVHLSGGTIEAHFHFFILIGLIALYQDWVPFLWDVVFTVLSHGLGSVTDVDSMYNHYAAQNRPWLWAFIHGIAVLAGCAGVMIFWRSTEVEQQRNSALVAELSDTEIAAAQREASQRQSISELLVNLARRNQSLMDRQLHLIAELEQREREPEALADLFHLDHLATRIRRNAESLLVLSGDEPPRRWGRPVPLAEVVRAAAAEVEDYRRVEVLVNDHLEVAGRAVADLSHLLAELIENATMFSPPSSQVRVRSHLAPIEPPAYVLSVEDSGIGMTEPDLKAANAVLAAPTEVDLRRSRLGFNVVSRLAHRYGLRVHLAHTPGGGITALVTLPDDLVSVRPPAPPLPPPPPPPPLPPGPPLPPPPPPPLPGRVGGPLDQEPWPSAVISDMPTMDPDATPAPSWAVPATSALASPAARAIPETGDQAAVGFQITGRPTADQVDDDGPLPPPMSPPQSPAAAPVAPGNGEADEPAPTLGGLARRVPGAALATSLRRDADAAAEPPNGASDAWPPGFPQDRERVGSMLSRFQAGLRNGRAAVQAESEPAAPDAPDVPEEDS